MTAEASTVSFCAFHLTSQFLPVSVFLFLLIRPILIKEKKQFYLNLAKLAYPKVFTD